MTITRQTTRFWLLLTCWLVSFLPRMASADIKPTFIIECNNPDVTAEVEGKGDYSLSGKIPVGPSPTISATWTQGSESGTINIYPLFGEQQGTYSFQSDSFKPSGVGVVTIHLEVTYSAFNLSISRADAQVSISTGGVTTEQTSFASGTKVTIKAEGWTRGDTTLTAKEITGYSIDGQLILRSSVENPEVTFTMPASDVIIAVETSSKIKLPGGTGEDRTLVIESQPSFSAKGQATIESGKRELEVLDVPAELRGETFCPLAITLTQENGTPITTLDTPMRIAMTYPNGVTSDDGIYVLHLATTDHPSTILLPTLGKDSLSFEVSGFSDFLLIVTRTDMTLPTGISFASSSIALTVGKESDIVYELAFSIIPTTDTVKYVFFRSTDERVATVNNAGHVTALNPGTCTIIGHTLFGSHKASCTVTVTRVPDPDPDPVPDPAPDPDPDPDPDHPTSVEKPSSDAPRALGTKGALILISSEAIRVDVYARTGHSLLNGHTVNGTFRLPLAAGLYFVRFADGTTHKVIIR